MPATPPTTTRSRSPKRAATTETTAKSPCRRANSANPQASGTGSSTPVSTSSSARSLCRAPTNSPSASTRRVPPGPATCTAPAHARSTAGSSAAGSAWARLPPRVPRLRIAVCPIQPAAAAASGCPSWAARAVWRTSAPACRTPSRTSRSARPGTRLTSTSTSGRAMRRASTGTSDWPPARILPSPSASASAATASATSVARWYSKGGHFTGPHLRAAGSRSGRG